MRIIVVSQPASDLESKLGVSGAVINLFALNPYLLRRFISKNKYYGGTIQTLLKDFGDA